MASRLQDVLLRGTAAARPAATTVAPGTLYFATDTSVTTRCADDGLTWEAYSGANSGSITGQYGSTTVAAGSSGTSKTLDWDAGNTQLLTLTGNCVLTLSTPRDGFRYLIVLLQDATGTRTVTWPTAVKWAAGTAPVLTTAANKADLITLVWLAGLGASGNYLAAANTNYTPA